jgi:hypothetical protein
MPFFHQFNVFAASRNEGLHPKLRDLLERASASAVFGGLAVPGWDEPGWT